MNTIAYFEIQSSNPPRDVRFYNAVFGWKFTRQEQISIEYYAIETNGINGGLLKRPATIPPQQHGTNAFVCTIEVDNFDGVSKLILQNEGQIAMPKFAIPSLCWQGYFLDPDGNTFGILQLDKNAK